MRPLRSRNWRAAVAVGAVAVLTGSGLLLRYPNALDDLHAHWAWCLRQQDYRDKPDGLLKDLAVGRIGVGTPVGEVMRRYRPHHTERAERYELYGFCESGTDVAVLVNDGRVSYAIADYNFRARHVFFGRLDAAEQTWVGSFLYTLAWDG